MWGVYHNTPVGRQQFGSATLVFVDGHLRLRAPYPVRSAKLSNRPPLGQWYYIGMGTGRSADRYPQGDEFARPEGARHNSVLVHKPTLV